MHHLYIFIQISIEIFFQFGEPGVGPVFSGLLSLNYKSGIGRKLDPIWEAKSDRYRL